MKKRKKKNAITLLALVITIVIMLLLAGVAIQMTMGENGLIAKSVQAQKEQAKAELYDTAKLSYMSLNAKALENGQPSPQAELALSTTEFTNKYNVVGDDITDKKGTIIDTKANVLNIIQGTVAGGFTPGATSGGSTPTPASWPKTVAGVTIPEEDKDKMVLKLKVLGNKEKIRFEGGTINIDYGNGNSDQELNLYGGKEVEYNQGEYILKISEMSNITVKGMEQGEYDIEVLQWGRFQELPNEQNEVALYNISRIYEPEPDKIRIDYNNGKFTEIPEWLFSKKVTSRRMSCFIDCEKITSIPENLFKNCINVEEFNDTFNGTRITSIPENLFKYNTRVKYWEHTFMRCTELTSIPENLFKYNLESEYFYSTFGECTGLTSIPENLFKYNTNVKDDQGKSGFFATFEGCTGLTSIPENLFKYNTEVRNINYVFISCTGLTNIPENLFKYNTEVTNFSGIFENCTGITSIPENLFKYNTKVWSFNSIFKKCKGLLNIPENLFVHNINANSFGSAFEGCSSISYIPEKIIERVKNKTGVFIGCTSASNYSSLPAYMK